MAASLRVNATSGVNDVPGDAVKTLAEVMVGAVESIVKMPLKIPESEYPFLIAIALIVSEEETETGPVYKRDEEDGVVTPSTV